MSARTKLLNMAEAVAGSDMSQTIGVAQGLEPKELIHYVHDMGIQHIVQKDGLLFDAEIETSKLMMERPKEFLDNPVSSILGANPGGLRFAWTCAADEKKTSVLTAFGSFVAQIPGSRRIWDQALLVADELYTNGSKNAWDSNSHLFNGPSVRQGKVEFFAESDGKRLVIGCRDSFGKLRVGAIVERIRACYVNGISESIRRGTAGAGIGSFMVFDACCSYYAAVEPGRRTFVGVALPLGISLKQAAILPKNIHLLNYPSTEVVK